MKINTQELKNLLNLEDRDLKNLSVEQLRVLLGVWHYMARLTQRELNGRTGEVSA